MGEALFKMRGIVFRRPAWGHKKIIYAYPAFLFHRPAVT
jgi:hypothetical protein|tara:strand:+ start:9917 stop:10033 length:117 start_codon:yes stop_codon:yes gene_type:complete